MLAKDVVFVYVCDEAAAVESHGLENGWLGQTMDVKERVGE